MSASTIFTPHEVLNKGFKFTGDSRSGYHATVQYLTTWANAFYFMDEVLASANPTIVGPWQINLPKRYPTGAIMIADSVDITPCGADGSTYMPNQGLRPGEFFTHAICTVQYNTPTFSWSGTDDPNNLQQLDPASPIVRCEQAVKMNAKGETRQGSKWKYDSDSVVVKGNFTVLIIETNLTLTFPKVPFLPWQVIKPYLGRVNQTSILGCAAETLLLLGANTVAKPTTGPQGTGIAQQVVLEFAVNEDNWNFMDRPDGSRERIHKAFGTLGVDTLYRQVDFNGLLNYLSSYE